MPLETATYISDLVASNPAHSDGLNQSDAHARLIKSAIKSTFPNINGAVTATQAQLNATTALATSGAALLNHSGVYFDNGAGAASTDGLLNTLAGDIDVQLQGTIAFTFQRTAGVNTFKANGGITATGEIKGPGITPVGSAVMWFDDTLPTDGLWAWANGGIISNANVVAPILLARWGSRYGGNGTTTIGVPNLQEVVPVGKSGMGGATAPGLLTSISTGFKDVLMNLFGSDTKTLSTSNLPPYTPTGTITNGQITLNGAANVMKGNSAGSTFPLTGGFNFSVQDMTNSPTQAASTFAGGPQGGTSVPFSVVQPSRAVNWIIRIG